MLSYHAVSDPGCVRAENEDRVLADPGLGLFIAADGMGGHRHGELAAELAISTMKYFLESSFNRCDVTWPFGYNFGLSLDANRLVTCIRLANRQVWKRSEDAPEYAGMGTTIAAVIISQNAAAIANVGDSRVYLFRRGELQQLTIDDTWLNTVLQKGTLDRDALLNHPMRNVLTQAAGSQQDIDVHTKDLDLQDSDLLLLSTDGLHEIVPDDTLRSILASGANVQDLTAHLKNAARAEGGPDNISCVVLKYES
jgi:protein phosphatase